MPLLALTPFALGALLTLHATLSNPYAVLTRFGGGANAMGTSRMPLLSRVPEGTCTARRQTAVPS